MLKLKSKPPLRNKMAAVSLSEKELKQLKRYCKKLKQSVSFTLRQALKNEEIL